ncbi:MAG: AAA family ATPase [Bacillota bacterium]
MVNYIHILGPSGSGTTTLGKKLQEKLNYTHFDSDDYFWLPTDPPYQKKRSYKKRQKLLMEDIGMAESWIISGSFCGWGDIFIPYFDLVIYLWVPTDIRIQRLKEREKKQFGDLIKPGGKMYQTHIKFLEWAAKYDTGDMNMRSKKLHEKWMSELSCPVLRIEGVTSLKNSIDLVLDKIDEINNQKNYKNYFSEMNLSKETKNSSPE